MAPQAGKRRKIWRQPSGLTQAKLLRTCIQVVVVILCCHRNRIISKQGQVALLEAFRNSDIISVNLTNDFLTSLGDSCLWIFFHCLYLIMRVGSTSKTRNASGPWSQVQPSPYKPLSKSTSAHCRYHGHYECRHSRETFCHHAFVAHGLPKRPWAWPLDWCDSQLHIHHAFHSYSGGIPAVLVHEFVQLAVKSSNR